MIVAGCDVGSLSAEAVFMENGTILGSEIIRVRPKAAQSAGDVMERLLKRLNLTYEDITFTVATGYGRETIDGTLFVNASVVDARYRPVNAPLVVEL